MKRKRNRTRRDPRELALSLRDFWILTLALEELYVTLDSGLTQRALLEDADYGDRWLLLGEVQSLQERLKGLSDSARCIREEPFGTETV